MAEKEKKEKKSWGYNDSKTGKKVSAFRDMFDGGGRGGSGASFSTLDHSDYHAAGGKNRDPNPTVSPSGFTRQTQDGRGETLTGFRGMMANPVMGGLLGAFTGGIGGAALGALRPAMGNQIRSNGGLLQTLGLQSKLAPNASMRPQIRPVGLGAVQEAAQVGSQTNPYGSYDGPFDPRPLSSLGTKPAPLYGESAAGMPPKNMSEAEYLTWLRGQNGAIDVNNMSQDGIRFMYDKYRTNPMFQ